MRNGSPLAKAHGAVARVSCTENHGASAALRPPAVLQPPMTTVSPSAFASIRNASPMSIARLSHGIVWVPFSSSAKNFMTRISISGNFGWANLGPAEHHA